MAKPRALKGQIHHTEPLNSPQILKKAGRLQTVLGRMAEGVYRAEPHLWMKEAVEIDCDEWLKRGVYKLFHGGNGRLSVRAGHGVGKSYGAAALAHYFLMNFIPSKILITGPCVEENEKILLADGRWVSVKDLNGRYFGVLAVKNDISLTPALANAFPNGIKPVYRLQTRSGREAVRTGNHPFRTLDGWVPLSSLKTGDFVGVPTSLPAHGQQILPEEDVKIIAYLLSEGCTTQIDHGHLYFAQNPGSVLEEMRACVEKHDCQLKNTGPRQYSITGRTQTSGGRGVNPLKDFCRHYGLDGQHSWEKRVPPHIFELNDELIKIFLSRLFAGDGYVRWDGIRELGYTTTSKELIHDVNRLVLRFGIAGRIRVRKREKIPPGAKSKRDLYHWYVTGPEAERFATEIGIFAKERQLENLLAKKHSRVRSTLFDTLPSQVARQTIQLLREASIPISRLMILEASKNIGRSAVQKVARLLKNTYLEMISQDHIGWDEITSIEYIGDRMTYGIEVPKFHTYLTDFVEHNTGKQTRSQFWSYMSDIWQKSIFKDQIQWQKTKMYVKGEQNEENWFALWVTSKEPKTIEGFHGPVEGRNLLWIVEEAKTVHNGVFEALAGALSHDDNYLYISSTCGTARGTFFDTHHSLRHMWETEHIPSTESSRVTAEKIELWKLQWGEDSPVYRARVLAEFPEDDDMSVAPISWLERSVQPQMAEA